VPAQWRPRDPALLKGKKEEKKTTVITTLLPGSESKGRRSQGLNLRRRQEKSETRGRGGRGTKIKKSSGMIGALFDLFFRQGERWGNNLGISLE